LRIAHRKCVIWVRRFIVGGCRGTRYGCGGKVHKWRRFTFRRTFIKRIKCVALRKVVRKSIKKLVKRVRKTVRKYRLKLIKFLSKHVLTKRSKALINKRITKIFR